MKCSILKNLKRIKSFIIVILIIIFSTIYPNSVNAKENEIIRVGVPTNGEFLEKEDDIYTGYLYDYLREISIYTGWEYEFIEDDMDNLLEDLRIGNIDILSGINKDEKNMEIYDFPKYDIGCTYTTLSVLNNNDFYSSKYIILDEINIGYLEDDNKNKNNFIEFCKENDVNDINKINLISYSDELGREILIEKIKSGEVDAILSDDLPKDSLGKVIAKFCGDSYYLATTKGNIEIIKGLNKAIYKIKEADPYFDKKLYNKYFKTNDYNILILNKEEENYIKNMEPIKAAYIDNYRPIQYYDEKTMEPNGVLVDAIKLMSEKSGIKFDFIRAKSYEEAYEMIRDNRVDIIIGVINNYSIADKNNFILTKEYLKLDLLKVVNMKKNKLNEDKLNKEVVALPIGEIDINLKDEYEIKYYENIEQCLEAVNEGIADSTYGNSYSIFNYIATGYYPNLNIIYDISEIEIAMAMSKNISKDLRNIINKIVYSISYKDIKSIIQKDIIYIKNYISFKEFFFNNLTLCLTIIAIIFCLILILVYMLIKMRFNKIKEDKKRLFKKTQLDPLTGVYNREAFENIVKKYLKEKKDSTYYAFIIIDIDYFKQINDRFGHKVGDSLLIDFTRVLKEMFSDKDVISRLGGDEFIIFMKDVYEDNIKSIENKLKDLCLSMDKEIKYNEKSQSISLSLGAIITRKNIEFNKLYTISDEILYQVKRDGRNGYKIKKI